MIRQLWELINATHPGVEWWEFWNPGSGLRGAAIAAFVAFSVILLLSGCIPEPCLVKDASGAWREAKPGSWHYENRLCQRPPSSPR